MAAAPRVVARGDWPQWRFDAARRGATPESGPERPTLLWHLDREHPDPAYDHQYRMCADASYAPVAAEGLVFLPSNLSDQVVACDLATGAIRWRYLAEGAVRFAPLYRAGRLYFVADDGCLHCVAADDGKLLWKVRGAPAELPDSRMLVGGRLCSRWPARGAPVEHQGVVYFGAGIWPEEGVYVCAVDAETGQLRWRSDRMSYIKNGMSDHGRSYDLSLPPQGYLAMIDGRLAVPSGRSLAAWFDPADGALEPYTCYYVKTNPPRGTWYLSGVGPYSVQGGNWFATRPDALPPLPAELKAARPAVVWSKEAPANEQYAIEHRPFLRADAYRLHNENLYTEPVLTETTIYASEFDAESKYLVPRGHTRVSFPEFDRIVARDLTRAQWKGGRLTGPAADKRLAQIRTIDFPVLWELASPLRVLIKAGDRLVAGGKDTIAAIAIPAPGEQPRVAWQAAIGGTPVHALVADHRLVVVTDAGQVYCFGAGGKQLPPPPPPSQAQPETATAAEEDGAVGPPPGFYGSPSKGYACVIGWGDGSQALSLARDGDQYRIVVFEPDPAKAAEARQRLADAGFFGRHAQVVAARPEQVRLAPYWASLVVVGAIERGAEAEARLSACLDLLRPYGGELRLAQGRIRADLAQRLLAARSGYSLASAGEGLTVRRLAPPEGADDWTHEAGGPENCFANAERLVRWPLGVLWYSGDIDRFFTPALHFQHQRQPFPLVAGGRMFLITGVWLHAIDVYTGSYLWKAEMPLTPWVQTRFFDSRMYGRPTERNCVAAADRAYVVTGEQILAYDAATGRRTAAFDVPPPLRDQAEAATPKPEQVKYMGISATIQAAPEWTEVRLWNDLLLAVVGRTLVAVNRYTGELRWMRPSTRQTTTCAVGHDTLFALDYDMPTSGGGRSRAPMPGLLVTLRPAGGEPIWQKPFNYAPVPDYEVDNPRVWLLPIIPQLAYNSKHRLLVVTTNRNSVDVLHAADGSPAWSKANPPSKSLQRVYPPAVTDDYLVLSHHNNCFAYLVDIRTGRDAGENTGIPQPRTCARISGNSSLLVYRDAATELYDVPGNRMIGLNSVRAGCTGSFIPADGVMTAPMLGHGCVCNYPMFASLGLNHSPEAESYRPAAVTESWGNQLARPAAGNGTERAGANDDVPQRPLRREADPFAAAGRKVDVTKFRLLNATVQASGVALRVSTKDAKEGYAVERAANPLERAVFTFALKRAPDTHRHGNAFFVCGTSERPDEWIQCRLYYGGRSSMSISGPGVESVEERISLARAKMFAVTVSVDCPARTVTFEAGGKRLSAKITRPMQAITHYGYGGSNSDNDFTEAAVE